MTKKCLKYVVFKHNLTDLDRSRDHPGFFKVHHLISWFNMDPDPMRIDICVYIYIYIYTNLERTNLSHTIPSMARTGGLLPPNWKICKSQLWSIPQHKKKKKKNFWNHYLDGLCSNLMIFHQPDFFWKYTGDFPEPQLAFGGPRSDRDVEIFFFDQMYRYFHLSMLYCHLI